EELREAGAAIILANTYHLMLRPGSQLIADFGGLHSFMHWDGPILTDSGGFQVFSLGHLRKLSEEGATFKSHLDGSLQLLTPESVMSIEAELGTDIILPLDICAAYPCTLTEAKEAMNRTHRWAERALFIKEQYRPEQALFGIVQGAFDRELREQSARLIGNLPFPGFAIGGLSVGEPKAMMWEMLRYVTPVLPRDKPRHLLGVGSPEDLVLGVGLGMDMFDCVLPTRVARHGGLFTPYGRINIKSARFRAERGPIEEGCDCYTCQNYSAAYVHHLARTEEQLYYRLGSIHNIRWMQPSISLGRFQSVEREIDSERCQQLGVALVRRPTGGRAVYHRDEFTYSIVIGKRDGVPAGVVAAYAYLALGLIAALQSLGVPTVLSDERVSKQPSAACFASSTQADLTSGGF